MLIHWKQFGGIAPLKEPNRLELHEAQEALNCELRNAAIRSLPAPAYVTGYTKTGVQKTIYRFGQSNPNEGLYWFTWADDVDVARGQIAGDTEERTFFTGDSTKTGPQWTDASLALTGSGDYPIASYKLGVPLPLGAPVAGTIGGSGNGTLETRLYVYCYVTEQGDVGQPSEPLEVQMEDGQTIELSNLLVAPAGHNVNRKWLYRSIDGFTTGTDFQFVAEIVDSDTTYVDTKLAKDLGATMFSLDYEQPPVDLRGIVNLPNGIMAGFVGNDIYLSEAFRPYAWPTKYRLACDSPIVGLGVYGETLVVGTRGVPELVFGTDPNSMMQRKLELQQACVSKRSIVSMGFGVMYASPDGLVLVSAGSTDVVTRDVISKEFWTSLNPASIHAYHYDGRYIGFYDNGEPGSFIFDPTSQLQPFSLTTVTCDAAYNDLRRDALFLGEWIPGEPGTGTISKWGSATPLAKLWRSGIIETPKRINFAWAKVEAQSYPITYTFYAGGVQKLVKSVTDSRPFRLPSGFTADRWEWQVTGTPTVTGVYLAQNSAELQQS